MMYRTVFIGMVVYSSAGVYWSLCMIWIALIIVLLNVCVCLRRVRELDRDPVICIISNNHHHDEILQF
jgi:hypothetical protein